MAPWGTCGKIAGQPVYRRLGTHRRARRARRQAS